MDKKNKHLVYIKLPPSGDWVKNKARQVNSGTIKTCENINECLYSVYLECVSSINVASTPQLGTYGDLIIWTKDKADDYAAFNSYLDTFGPESMIPGINYITPCNLDVASSMVEPWLQLTIAYNGSATLSDVSVKVLEGASNLLAQITAEDNVDAIFDETGQRMITASVGKFDTNRTECFNE